MRITRTQLRQIIKEELEQSGVPLPPGWNVSYRSGVPDGLYKGDRVRPDAYLRFTYGAHIGSTDDLLEVMDAGETVPFWLSTKTQAGPYAPRPIKGPELEPYVSGLQPVFMYLPPDSSGEVPYEQHLSGFRATIEDAIAVADRVLADRITVNTRRR